MIVYSWTGDSFEPLPRFGKQCDQEFVVGQRYALEVVEQRSSATHRHYFAQLNDAWGNLPEEWAEELPTSEHLRAWGLIKAGFADKTMIKCATNDDAISAAREFKRGEKIKIVEVAGRIVTVWTPHSQSLKSMGKATFQDSKSKVLEVVAQLIGVPSEEFRSSAGKAA